MKDIGSMSPAELLAEWKTCKFRIGKVSDKAGEAYEARLERASRALDGRCEAAGITIENGWFAYAALATNRPEPFMVVYPATRRRIYARDQQALQEWLLIRPKTT